MRILITGGAGFIGSNLVRLALQQGHHVLNVDALTYAGNLKSLADVSASPAYRFLHLDITDSAGVANAVMQFSPDAVMHLAAESHVDRSITGPGSFVQTNVIGTYHLLQASLAYWRTLTSAKAKLFRFLHVSTDEVYGSLEQEGSFNETTAYAPHSPYAASKASSDHIVRAWHDTYDLPVLVTHSSNNFGPYQFPEKLVPVVILKCLGDQPIPLYGKGENVRDWLYVEDHCRALMDVVTKGKPGETYDIGGSNEFSNLDLARNLCQILDEYRPCQSGSPHTEKITFVTDRPGHDFRYAIDASKIKRDLGWEPREDFQAGIRKTVRWYLDNRSWWQDIMSGNYRLDTHDATED
ncbi:dTDP-glucose 4,6-dehydratase [Rubripirellula amarantea]|nr:dTDP-glucose 4,6-dehydratase [Rubripirellula amarantea]